MGTFGASVSALWTSAVSLKMLQTLWAGLKLGGHLH